MKRKVLAILTTVMTTLFICSCGKDDPAIIQFQKDVNNFCEEISKIDTAINEINADDEDAPEELLTCLDNLDLSFRKFSEMDFPEEYDYLEDVADEASSYMTTAVENFHKAYGNASYNEYVAEYAEGNYARAYKRIKIILSFLHGETPDGVNLTMDEDDDE